MSVRDLRGKHWGASAWLIGNGKSLVRTDPRQLGDAITFGFNSIFLFDGFLPTYHLVEDVLVAEDRAEEINAYDGPVKIFPRDVSHWLNGSATRYVDFKRGGSDAGDWPGFSVDCDRLVYWGGTVSYMALQLAYYMGVQTVYLVGMDKYKPPTPGSRHEGAVITSDGDDPNHFDPRYFGKGLRWHDPDQARMCRAHARAREVFENAGRRIIDCTPRDVASLEGVYESADIGEVLS